MIKFPCEFSKWAWIAGYLDGEGCFALTHTTPSGRNYYPMHLTVASSDKRPLEMLKMTLGIGSLWLVKHKNPKHNNSWYYQISRGGLETLLPNIVDFLIVKKDQAELLLYEAIPLVLLGKGKGRYNMTDEYKEKMHKLIERIRLMKGRK